VRAAFIDHVTILVRDYEASRAFYRGALAPGAAGSSTSATRPAFGPRAAKTFTYEITMATLTGFEPLSTFREFRAIPVEVSFDE